MNEEQVLREHGDYVRAYARKLNYFLPGGDQDDLEQEALIGLMRACRTFKPEVGRPFWPGFALDCVLRQLWTAIKTANTGGRQMLNHSWRVGYNEEGQEQPAVELMVDPRADVVDLLAAREELERVLWEIDALTPLRRGALVGVAAGYTYDELAHLGNRKRIDNAVQAARRKLREAA